MIKDSDALAERVQAVLAHAVAGLDPQDSADRAEWCREHNQHGVRMHLAEGDDVLEFRWGGRLLAMIRRADLLSDDLIQAEFVSEVPDTLPDDF